MEMIAPNGASENQGSAKRRPLLSEPEGKSGHNLDAALRMARVLATQHSLDSMLPELLAALAGATPGMHRGILFLYDEIANRLLPTAAYAYSLDAVSGLSLAPGEAIAGKAFAGKGAVLYPSADAVASAMADLSPENRRLMKAASAGQPEPACAVALPLTTETETLGVLILEGADPGNPISEEQAPFLQQAAGLIALAIRGARQQENAQAASALSEANRLKAELLSTLAHEMRTPLASIKGYSTALLMDNASFSERTQREFLEIIDQECDTLEELIHDLLETSVIDAGLLKLEYEPVLLPRLVRTLIDDIAHRTHKHRFLVDFPDRFPVVDADSKRIVQVFRNLIDNAVKYSPDGGLIAVRGEVRENEVVVSVADQGVGISPEDLNRLFERFFRARSGMGRHVVGSGLGLPIARTIVESHGGRIWADSQVGRGSTLHFTLPLSEPEEPERGDE